VLEELNSLFTKGVKFVEPSDLSGSIRGRQNLYNQMDMMLRGAEKSITIVTTRDGLNRKMEAIMPTLEKCKKRGVRIRIAAPIDNSNIKVAKEFKKIAEIKDIEGKMKARFLIIDSNQIMFMLLDDEKFHPNYDVGIWINTDFFSQALEQMFEIMWKDLKQVK
jgi:sugar-specific transcriptional regulator TrmB